MQAEVNPNNPSFKFHGKPTPGLSKLAQGLKGVLEQKGYRYKWYTFSPRLVLNFISPDEVKPYRRRSQATFVLSVMEVDQVPPDPLRKWYAYLVRGLSNLLLVYVPGSQAHFLSLDLGHTVEPEGKDFYERLFERIHPMASSVLVVNNRFEPDLEPELRDGNQRSQELSRAGRKLGEWNLLPTPFPMEELLSEQELRHVKRLYGIGGLSYGNLSVRQDGRRFWMSASGVDKSNLTDIGRDILLVKAYDNQNNAIVLSVPPEVQPRRVSVDAIEHWMIYQEHPEVGAIIHVHAWMEGVPETQLHYPCGTYQLGKAVADRVKEADDPANAVVGLKNHGLTITGRSISDILSRIDGKLIRQVPMK